MPRKKKKQEENNVNIKNAKDLSPEIWKDLVI